MPTPLVKRQLWCVLNVDNICCCAGPPGVKNSLPRIPDAIGLADAYINVLIMVVYAYFYTTTIKNTDCNDYEEEDEEE